MEHQSKHQENGIEEPPPLLKSWSRLYTAVIAILAILIAFFYSFTEVFR